MAFDTDDPTSVINEPEADASGANLGLLGMQSDYVLWGVYNGEFAKGPPDPSSNIEAWSQFPTGSNFVPAWRFYNSSNTNITGSQVRDPASPSGSNFRFTYASGAAGDEARIETFVDVGGSRSRQMVHSLRVTIPMATMGANPPVYASRAAVILTGQYLTVDYVLVGPQFSVSTDVLSDTDTYAILSLWGVAAPPATAKFLRIRVITNRGGATNASTGYVDIADVRLDRGGPRLLIADETGGLPGVIVEQSRSMQLRPENATNPSLLLNVASGDASVLLNANTNALSVSSGHLRLSEVAAPGTPASGKYAIYAKSSDSHLYGKNDAGTEVQLDTGGGATFAAPALTLGTSNVAGAAATVLATDSTILAFDATAPTTQALGDAAAAGSATVTARRDHKHAMPSATATASGLTMATAKMLGRATVGTGALEEIATTGTGSAVLATSPALVTPALGTPSALVGTNITGTAAGLTAGAVTTNANLTGDVTSVGNVSTLGTSGTWTPVLAYATPGTSSWAASVQVGRYRLYGKLCFFDFFITAVPTNGTASGNLQIQGFPFTSVNVANASHEFPIAMTGFTKAGSFTLVGRVSVNSTAALIDVSTTAAAITSIAVADIPTGGTVTIKGTGFYETA